MQTDLSGKRVLVTGGSQGIGRVIAKSFAQCGCEVIVNCARHRENAEAVAAEIRDGGGKAVVYICDVSDEKSVQRMFQEVGEVDILINNARLDPWNRTGETTEGEWFTRVLEVNLRGAFLCSWEFFRRARERKFGRIVNISSVRAYRPSEMSNIGYAASKAGMHALTRAFAHNGAKLGITANTVCPGMVTTENIWKRLSPEKYQEECDAVPLGRPAEGAEIAEAVLFAVRNEYVTGETININGGMFYAP